MELTLHQVLAEGDWVRVKAILVPESGNEKNIRYLATSLVSGKTRRAVREMRLPEMEPLESIDQIHPSKINNFYSVVSAVCLNLLGSAEEECRGVSTDEEQEAAPVPAPAPRPDSEVVRARSFARSGSSLSLDAAEAAKEKKRLAKANECLQRRRKLGYDRAEREALLLELKLKNQLLWRCRECNITCGKAGMEKHVVSKTHWDKVLDNYKKLLETEQAVS